MSYSVTPLETGHTQGVPADTVHLAAHKIMQNFEDIETELASRTESITVKIDAGTIAITPGQKGLIYPVLFDGIIQSWTLYTDASLPGSIELDIRKTTYANYPTDENDSIVGDNPIVLDDAVKATDNVLDGWTTQIYAGEVLEVVVTSADTCKWIVVAIEITRQEAGS